MKTCAWCGRDLTREKAYQQVAAWASLTNQKDVQIIGDCEPLRWACTSCVRLEEIYRMTEAEKALFWSKVDQSGDGCWEWQAGKFDSGYGCFAIKARSHHASRVAWVLTNGAMVPGMFVCHHCDNPPCVRPDHLFLGTSSDNNRDAAAKGRTHRPIGESHPSAKFTDLQVEEIRRRRVAGEPLASLAAAFGASESTISQFANYRRRTVATPVKARQLGVPVKQGSLA